MAIPVMSHHRVSYKKRSVINTSTNKDCVNLPIWQSGMPGFETWDALMGADYMS